MAFIVQTYPFTPGANSYGAVSDFLSYHADRMNTAAATYATPLVQAALIKATAYIDVRFSYVGWRTDKTQTTEWPRNGAFNDRGDLVTGLPLEVQQACYEYALRQLALGTDLMTDPTRDETGRPVKRVIERIGPIESEVEFDSYGADWEMPIYPLADRILTSRALVYMPKQGGVSIGALERS